MPKPKRSLGRKPETVLAITDYKTCKIFFTKTGIYAYGPKKEVNRLARLGRPTPKKSTRKKTGGCS